MFNNLDYNACKCLQFETSRTTNTSTIIVSCSKCVEIQHIHVLLLVRLSLGVPQEYKIWFEHHLGLQIDDGDTLELLPKDGKAFLQV